MRKVAPGIVVAACLLWSLMPAFARAQAEAGTPAALLERETLTDQWFGFGRELSERGIEVALGVTQVAQVNTLGGTSTHRRSGRYAGSYDLAVGADLETLLGWTGARFVALAEGSWSDGLDASSIGSLYGVNADAAGDRAIDVTELWYQQHLADGRLSVRIGKLDPSASFEARGRPGGFDASMFANDETSQFLNGALVNNPTIPFPDNGLGAIVHWNVTEWLYASAAVSDARADVRETGFRTAFHGRDDFFSVYELGLLPDLDLMGQVDLPGAYRFGLWYDPQPKDRWDGSVQRDDVGAYLTFDQVIWRENPDGDDGQGVGLFGRFGWTDPDSSELHWFWSVGGQVQGLIPGRDDDVLGVGFAHGRLAPGGGFGSSREAAVEVYYNARVAGWLSVSPSVQWLWNPGGVRGNDALVVGLRIQAAI